MRLPILFSLVILAVGMAIDSYLYRRLRLARANRFISIAFLIISAIATLALGFVACASKKAASDSELIVLMWCLFTYFSIYIPKYIFAIICLIQQILSKAFKRQFRGLIISGAVITTVMTIAMWWGALVTRFHIDVREVKVEIPNLPSSFCGYRIVQISDIHTGTFAENPRFLHRIVETIDTIKPDLILFTGDIVNRHSIELRPFMTTLGALYAPDGVWSVMGNHDYGEYSKWNSEADRLADVDSLKTMQNRMGWRMLNNEHTVLRHGNDSIVLIGVENIGDPPFTTYGSLRKAYPAIHDSSTKILMSHNPAHWTDSIADNPDANIALTLSGHTHAMQIRIFGWSPSSLRYKTWGGLYSDSLDKKLYVNIGIGEVGFPARIGATPEITVITLSDKNSTECQTTK